jgi:putative MFS transporter
VVGTLRLHAELYPTQVRVTGFASAIGRIGSLTGPSLIGFILPTAGQSGVFALGANAFVIVAPVVLVLGAETTGRTLESISH